MEASDCVLFSVVSIISGISWYEAANRTGPTVIWEDFFRHHFLTLAFGKRHKFWYKKSLNFRDRTPSLFSVIRDCETGICGNRFRIPPYTTCPTYSCCRCDDVSHRFKVWQCLINIVTVLLGHVSQLTVLMHPVWVIFFKFPQSTAIILEQNLQKSTQTSTLSMIRNEGTAVQEENSRVTAKRILICTLWEVIQEFQLSKNKFRFWEIPGQLKTYGFSFFFILIKKTSRINLHYCSTSRWHAPRSKQVICDLENFRKAGQNSLC